MKFYALAIANAVMALLVAFDLSLSEVQQGAIIGLVNALAIAGDAGWAAYQKTRKPSE